MNDYDAIVIGGGAPDESKMIALRPHCRATVRRVHDAVEVGSRAVTWDAGLSTSTQMTTHDTEVM